MTRVVYFAESPLGMIKIGTSQNAHARLQSLGGDSLRLLATTPGGFALEKDLHNRFCHFAVRSRGPEWFWPCPDLLNVIRRAKRGIRFTSDHALRTWMEERNIDRKELARLTQLPFHVICETIRAGINDITVLSELTALTGIDPRVMMNSSLAGRGRACRIMGISDYRPQRIWACPESEDRHFVQELIREQQANERAVAALAREKPRRMTAH